MNDDKLIDSLVAGYSQDFIEIPTLTTQVRDFHEKFGIPQRKIGDKLDQSVVDFRLKFMLEEITEFTKAVDSHDLPEVLDALVDLVYVAIGTAEMLNLPFEDAWEGVHYANMQKVRVRSAADSKRKSEFDVVKPDGWEAPDHRSLFPAEDLVHQKPSTISTASAQLDLIDYINELDSKEIK